MKFTSLKIFILLWSNSIIFLQNELRCFRAFQISAPKFKSCWDKSCLTVIYSHKKGLFIIIKHFMLWNQILNKREVIILRTLNSQIWRWCKIKNTWIKQNLTFWFNFKLSPGVKISQNKINRKQSKYKLHHQ